MFRLYTTEKDANEDGESEERKKRHGFQARPRQAKRNTRRYGSSLFVSFDPGGNFVIQDVEGESAIDQDFVVEGADVEFGA